MDNISIKLAEWNLIQACESTFLYFVGYSLQ